MKTFADAEARLAEAFPGYESRPQQQAFAAAAEGFFGDEGNRSGASLTHLIAQAGCGTGKSFGYLIPAILSGKRTVISVTTKALQDQLSEKDVPFLQANLGVPFTWAVLKGRTNYFCPVKAESDDDVAPHLLARLIEAAQVPGFDGERGSFGFEIADSDWSRVCADSETCSALECSKEKENPRCFAQRARLLAKAARIVIVNHALYFTDLMVFVSSDGNFSMIDQHDFVVFDEAHETEDVATERLGATFTEGAFNALANNLRGWAERYADVPEPVTELLPSLRGAVAELWVKLEPGRIRAAHLLGMQDELIAVSEVLGDLRSAFFAAKMEEVEPGAYDKAKKRKDMLLSRIDSVTLRFNEVITASFDDKVRFVETERKQFRGRWEERKIIKSLPITVAPFLRDHLFARTPALLVSATLKVNGAFDFPAQRLGIDTYGSLDVGTPFTFEKQALTYVPQHLPEPTGAKVRAWEQMVNTEIVELVKASDGRALLLFTSNKHLRETYAAIKDRIPFTTMCQGEAAPKVLTERFKSDTHSVLFATKSFFTGFDVQGEALSLVIIAKMPFPVPTEPMTEARCELIKKNGGNDFSDYTIPVMSLILQQGYGRLIRHREDRGVVAILDPRLKTKGYGNKILRDLPPAPVATTLADVEEFFSREAVSA